jgi:hypothetical protein
MEQSKFSTSNAREVADQYALLTELNRFFDNIGYHSTTIDADKIEPSEQNTFPSFSEFALRECSMSTLVKSQRKVDALVYDDNINYSDDDSDDDSNDDSVDDSDGCGGYIDDVDGNIAQGGRVCKPSDKQSKKKKDPSIRATVISRANAFHLGAMTCRCAVSCVQKLTLAQVRSAQERFWGSSKKDYPSSKKRSELMFEILRSGFHGPTKTFKFDIHDPIRHVFDKICETAMVTILFGPTEDSNVCTLTTAPRVWRTLKQNILKSSSDNGVISDACFATRCSREKAANRNKKREYCRQYITTYSRHHCEASVIESGVKFLPFRSLKCFYDDYVLNLLVKHGVELLKDHLVSERTFGRALNEINKDSNEKIRFMRAKGSFNSCEVCVTAAELLTKRRFSQTIRELIGMYRGYAIN